VSWLSGDGRRSVETDTPSAVVTQLAERTRRLSRE
jgi:hypothetical protein